MPVAGLRGMRERAAREGLGVVLSEDLQAALDSSKTDRTQLEKDKADSRPISLPPTTTTPHPFQYAGIRFVYNSLKRVAGALLADDMGLGKTFQALSVVGLRQQRDGKGSSLVLCPASLKYVWEAEVQKHYPYLRTVVIDGSAKKRQEQWNTPADLFIANYDLLVVRHQSACIEWRKDPANDGKKCVCPSDWKARDIALKVRDWDVAIFDEITFLKNYRAERTKRAKKLRRKVAIGLSGIPIENKLEDLHSVMDVIIPGLLGPGWLFMDQHAIRDRWGSVKGYKGISLVREKVGPYYIRRRKADVIKELPPKVYTDYSIELTAREWSVYDAIRHQIVSEIRDNEKLQVFNILTMILRLKQAADDIRLLGEPIRGVGSKIKAVEELVEASEGHAVVFFTQFSEMADLLVDQLDCPIIKGVVPAVERQRLIERFQDNGHLLVSTDAGAYGLTLTRADIIVHIDQPWNPAKLRQREDRLHRIGQESSVQVVTLMANRTVDHYVRRILEAKLKLIGQVLDEDMDEIMQQRLTREDLMEMLGDGSD